jgi:hypothetical protein
VSAMTSSSRTEGSLSRLDAVTSAVLATTCDTSWPDAADGKPMAHPSIDRSKKVRDRESFILGGSGVNT